MPTPIMVEKVHSARTGNTFFIMLVFSLLSNTNYQVTVFYNLPLRQEDESKEQVEVLPIDTPGGLYGTVPELLFEKKQLIPALQQLLASSQI